MPKSDNVPGLSPEMYKWLVHLAGTEERAELWLDIGNPDFGGETPRSIIADGHALAVEGLINDILWGQPG